MSRSLPLSIGTWKSKLSVSIPIVTDNSPGLPPCGIVSERQFHAMDRLVGLSYRLSGRMERGSAPKRLGEHILRSVVEKSG